MKREEKVKGIIRSFRENNEKVLVIDKRENLDKWHEFRCLTSDDISTLQDNSFDLVVVNDFTSIKSDFLKKLARVGNKYIILSPFVSNISESSKRLINDITKNDLDEVKFLDKIIDKKKILQRKKLEYIMLEKEDLTKSNMSDLFFNLALIQNLKAQIVEREKEIATKNKDIELLENRIRELEGYLSNSEEAKKQKNEELIKLGEILERTRNVKEKEIQKLTEDFRKQMEQKDQEIQKLTKQREEELKIREQQIQKLTKQKDQEIQKLTKQREEELKELIFNFGQRLKQKEEKIKELREDFERRKK